MSVATACAREIHYIDSYYLEWSFHGYRMQRWCMMKASPSNNCTLWAALAECHSICVHSFPPPVPYQSIVDSLACEVASLRAFVFFRRSFTRSCSGTTCTPTIPTLGVYIIGEIISNGELRLLCSNLLITVVVRRESSFFQQFNYLPKARVLQLLCAIVVLNLGWSRFRFQQYSNIISSRNGHYLRLSLGDSFFRCRFSRAP